MTGSPLTLLDRLHVALTRTISRIRGKHESAFCVRVVAEWDHEQDDVRDFLAAGPALVEMAQAAVALEEQIQRVGIQDCREQEARYRAAMDRLLAPVPPAVPPPRRKRS